MFTVAAVLFLVVLNGLFAMTEMAVVSSRRSRLEVRAGRGDRGADAALRLSEDPTQFLSAVQVGITLIGILAGAFGQATIADDVRALLHAWVPSMSAWSDTIATGLVVVGITYVSLVVGELVPKRIALAHPEVVASLMSRPVSGIALLLRPFVSVLTWSTAGTLRLLGIRDRDDSEVTQEEVETMIADGASAGLIEPAEREMIGEILTLGDRPVRVAMTPRGDVWWVALDDPPEVQRREIRECPYSRIVVTRDHDIDNPIGVAHKKDLLDGLLDAGELRLEAAVVEPSYIPESASVLTALEVLKRARVHMAFVVDEFGGLAGVVTATDLLEMIAGDFDEEHDTGTEAIREHAPGEWMVDGQVDLDELEDVLNEDFGERDGFHTAAGLVLHQLGRVPREGDTVRVGRFEAVVIDMDARRVDKLLFRVPAEAGAAEQEEA